MMPAQQQFYLRTEPTDDGRQALRAHQEHLAAVFRDLRVNPRLTRAADLHWTTLFLSSPDRRTQVMREIGVDLVTTTTDLRQLATYA